MQHGALTAPPRRSYRKAGNLELIPRRVYRPTLVRYDQRTSSPVQTPLNAAASTAGALLSSSTFLVPQFQREYSWLADEVADFFTDLRNNIDSDSYFLGLVILTDEDEDANELPRKHVVDGQQRLITLTLLANVIYTEARERGRKALADRIQADFLRSIDYESEDTNPRVVLSDSSDNATLQYILDTSEVPKTHSSMGEVSKRIVDSYIYLRHEVRRDIAVDPFKRLGRWTDFLTNRLYFAVFVHPNAASAYQVYEVINTRGKDLTTADLLKNYVLSQTAARLRERRYQEWQEIAEQFASDGANNFVQYIRHVVTVQSGHVLPKDLYGFLAGRLKQGERRPPNPEQLMDLLKLRLPLYLQMIDPTAGGPAPAEYLNIFEALNSLNVIAVRPILLALADLPNPREGMRYILRLVVRRIVVGNLGTGNIERKLGEAALLVRRTASWEILEEVLGDLMPGKAEFIEQLRKRRLNKAVLDFVRRSVVQETITPENAGHLHFIWAKQAPGWDEMPEKDGSAWGSTLGNTLLSTTDRRDRDVVDWPTFKELMLSTAVDGEWVGRLAEEDLWDADAVEELGTELAEKAGEIWYRP